MTISTPCGVTAAASADRGLAGSFNANVVKGALLCSGMYDLKPVRLSKRSEYVAFTDEVEERLSSQRHLDRLNCLWQRRDHKPRHRDVDDRASHYQQQNDDHACNDLATILHRCSGSA